MELTVTRKTISLDIEDFDTHLEKALEIVSDHIRNIAEEPVVPNIEHGELYELIPNTLPIEGIGVDAVLDDVRKIISPNCTKVGHPRFLAWITTSPCPAGTIGEILNLGLNQVAFSYKGGPAATVLEEIVTGWFGTMFGYDRDHGGVLVSGGTMANLTALAAARERHVPGAMQKGIQKIDKPLVLYVSEQGHMSVDRSCGMLGVGSDFVRKIPADAEFKMQPDILIEQIQADRSSGLEPFCVVAQAGAANTGAVDPLDRLADICAENGLWFHVDAAYGGAAMLAQESKNLMKGIDRADSIATDPHKWFFIPIEAGLTLVKNREHLYSTFKSKAGYVGDTNATEYLHHGFQMTRMSRALKTWFAFRAYGLDCIGKIISQNIELTKEFAKKLEANNYWEILAPVELSIACFRYVPDNSMSDDELNKLQYKILSGLEKSGRAFLTPTVLNGRAGVRICFANHRTSYEDLDILYDTLTGIAEKICAV